MTFKRLDIIDFESHKDTHLEFHKGVNVIIGPTDKGKSGALRAIYLVAQNEPSGDEYISHWAKESDVTLTTEEDISIRRVRNKSTKNLYYVSTYKDPFEGFGQGPPPEEIRKVLDVTDINIQYQLEGHFLLNSKAGDVAKYLNKMVNLEKISQTQTKINTMLKTAKGNKNKAVSELKTNQEKIKKFDWLSGFEKDLVRLEKEEAEIKLRDKKLDELENILNHIDEEESNLKKYERVASFSKQIELLMYEKLVIESREKKQKELDDLLDKIESCEASIEVSEKFSKCLPEIKKLLEEAQIIRNREKLLAELDDLLNNIIDEEKNQKRYEQQAKEYEDKFHKLMPDICPLCGAGGKKHGR